MASDPSGDTVGSYQELGQSVRAAYRRCCLAVALGTRSGSELSRWSGLLRSGATCPRRTMVTRRRIRHPAGILTQMHP